MQYLVAVYLFSVVFLSEASPYVTLPAANRTDGPVYTLSNFTWGGASGLVAVVHKPIGHFHIYFPETRNGGCGGYEKTSVQSEKHNCIFATNGGPFSFSEPSCIGNVVSDSKIVQDSGDSRNGESIGLTKDGNWILGHIDREEVKSLEFAQLTSAFYWLTKNGNVIPTPGGLIAPRTFAGINAAGELLLFVVDGHESKPSVGLTSEESAKIALKYGCPYSINLDGGGSTVAASLGKVISKPTCHDTPKPLCERSVTSVTCITE
eukprot:TRINITY_DN14439_c0_g1_i1.p1 TRINITY_DN14439_c0_g1~~TRINITY_DN14439_c0_g1_i1.p1  ORF type:complete len:263 (-),score=50.47 TRINITY_DN14439_c0_g1_i1:33-821(-)